MKLAHCRIGMLVRDTETGLAYKIYGERIYAADAGMYVVSLDLNPDGVRDTGVIHWSRLEPLTNEDGSEA